MGGQALGGRTLSNHSFQFSEFDRCSWARTDLNRRSTGYEPDALGRTKLRAHRTRTEGAAERSLGTTDGARRPFEPLIFRLTADRSAAELRRHRGRRASIALIAFPTRSRARVVVGGAFLQLLDEHRHPVEALVEVRPELPGLVRDDRAVR